MKNMSYSRALPLYNTLADKLIKRENFSITNEYRSRLEVALSNLDPPRTNQVTLLLIHYYFLEHPNTNPFIPENYNTKTSRNLPYNIKISSSGTGLSIDLNKLPTPLQALLGMYCCI